MLKFFRTGLLCLGLFASLVHAAETTPLSDADLQKIAVDADIYAYPLVLMELTKGAMTNVDSTAPRDVPRSPTNQFNKMPAFPDTTVTKFVIRPNVDTLYATAWLDLSKEPQVLTLPDSNRYYVMQMLDAWTNVFADPGTRLPTKAGNYAIIGPGWGGRCRLTSPARLTPPPIWCGSLAGCKPMARPIMTMCIKSRPACNSNP